MIVKQKKQQTEDQLDFLHDVEVEKHKGRKEKYAQ